MPSPRPDDETSPHHVLRAAGDADRFAWRARIRRNPHALFAYRVGVAIAGLLLMLGAAATGWLPGPGGIPLFMLGLLVWSSEFSWAQRIMLWFRAQFDRYLALPVRTRRALLAGCLALALLSWYLLAAWQGLPGWLPEPVGRTLDMLPLLER